MPNVKSEISLTCKNAPSSTAEKKRVLVIEDNEIAQKIARMVLAGLACEVDIAENGARALEFFKQNSYDLIFADLGLPDIDGCGVVSEIRKMEDKKNPVPIICLSVHSNEHSRAQAVEVGMNDYIVKPLTFENCQRVLAQFTSSQKLTT